MPSASWQDEARGAISKWPRVLRARLDTGIWQLLGASEGVQQEFRQWAQRIHLEFRFPSGETDAATYLLYRLKESGHHVWSKQDPKKHRAGSATITSNRERATIYPLRSALLKFLIDGPDVRPKAKPTSAAQLQDSGQAAAAKKNRVRKTRLSIIVALQRLGLPLEGWPGFVRKFIESLGQHPEYRQHMAPSPFQPPDFDRLNQSPKDWIKAADRAWQLHRDRFLDSCQYWATSGVDDEIPAAKVTRGPGSLSMSGKRGKNTAEEQRYEWAGQYLCRVPLKEIAAQSGAESSTVGRIARATLRAAEWPERRKRRGGN